MTTFNTKVSKRQCNVGVDRVSTTSSAYIRENSVRCNCENGYISDFSDVQKISNKSTNAARLAGSKNIRNSALMETSGNFKGSDLKYHKPTKHVRTERKQFVLTTQSKHVSGNEIALVSSKTKKSRSSAEDDIDGPTESKRQKCTTRNAVIARMNRLKKKSLLAMISLKFIIPNHHPSLQCRRTCRPM